MWEVSFQLIEFFTSAMQCINEITNPLYLTDEKIYHLSQ